MRYILILAVLLCACGQPKDPVDKSDRLDLENKIEVTKGTYNPKIDSSYFFPSDSSDVTSTTEYSDYRITTTIFPVINKYVTVFSEYFDERRGIIRDKVRYREYKLQVDITDHEGLHIKKVITKYDIPEAIFGTKPKYYFIRDVKFKELQNDEFRFDIKFSIDQEQEPAAMIKYYIPLVGRSRFEDYPRTFYDSLRPEPTED